MMKLFVNMTDKEIEDVDLVKFSKLNIGDKVRHRNEGKRYCPEVGMVGTVIGHNNHGLNSYGGLIVTVTVLWPNETFEMDHYLAVKIP